VIDAAIVESSLAQELYFVLLGTEMSSARSEYPLSPLADLSTSRLGKMLSKASKSGGPELPYVRNANVQWDALNMDDVSTMMFSGAEQDEFELKAGDVLVCEGGEAGRALVLADDLPGVFFQKAVHRV
jgi:type I restriction enzyme S subunit